MAARMENPKGDHDPIDMPEGGLEEEIDLEDFDNPFHDARALDNAMRGTLEERLIHALNINHDGIKIKVADFYRKMHTEDYLDWKASLKNYFEWKPMAKNRRCCL